MTVDEAGEYDSVVIGTYKGGILAQKYTNLRLTGEQKSALRPLYKRSNLRGLFSIVVDYLWIGMACALTLCVHPLLYPLSLLIIGARQRALASLFHDAAHRTLFKTKSLNSSLSRVLCGWPILQSLSAYHQSHVREHHPCLGDPRRDPDLREMKNAGVYEIPQGRDFFRKFVLGSLCGHWTLRYARSLILNRLSISPRRGDLKVESWCLLSFHAALITLCFLFDSLGILVLFWWLPLLVVFPVIGWLSELSEHYPFMDAGSKWRFSARNRYAGWLECLFIGMHGDSLHLTHHLLPGIPHWNLATATEILRMDGAFAEWDDQWGGIFSSDRPGRVTFVSFVGEARRA
ncbi:fatty acid desaturase family protein [Pandoraea capi]|uniref:Fatty acid desaturase family protein n=1 Tax=Pandoraea capi TaxID=2508286 RepID=A0ABY6VU39_9BURK|nr:fatty acid desaturase family protein [Pandoraea capi]VVD88843.1 fatty acid desaturase family protein [Pandoraea capi]